MKERTRTFCSAFLSLVFAAFIAFSSITAQAQDTDKSVLPASVQKVVDVLTPLGVLPAEEWKLHPGDLAHAESPDLDDSQWETVKAPSRGPSEACWYRRWIEVPKTLNGYDLTGAKIWFQFDIGASGMGAQAVYFNGRRVALGEDLEPVVLFENAKPGDKVLVAVKTLRAAEQKYFSGARLNIEANANRPSPLVTAQELSVAGELGPSAANDAASTLRTVESAAAAVNLQALARGDQAAFDASLNQAHALLDPVRAQLKGLTVQAAGNAHIDAAWLWPASETVDVVRRTFGSAVQLMSEYPRYTFSQSAAQYSEWMEQKYPALFDEIKQRVQQGRWELVGGMWVEPDLNMPDGESLVRQLLVGKRYFQQKFGVDVRIGWNPDSFGYTWQLPQIYKKSGIDYFVTQKMSWNETNQLPLKLFWWQSPDGSRILTYFPRGYVGSIDPLRLSADFTQGRSLAPGLPEILHLYGVGDHGGGPTREMLDRGLGWESPQRVFPKLHFGVAQEFFSQVEGKVDRANLPVWNYQSIAAKGPQLPAPPSGKISVPVWNDELYLEFHRGVFTTQAQHKRNMRESEEQLLNAEKYASLAWLRGVPYPGHAFNEAWKKIAFGQFHDLAAGSGIGIIYKDAQQDYDAVRWTAEESDARALQTLEREVNTRSLGGVPLIVWNPLAWVRTDLVTAEVQLSEAARGDLSILDARGAPQAIQVLSSNPATHTYRVLLRAEQVPSLGYKLFQATSGKAQPKSDLMVNGLTLENGALRVVVDPKTGCITSIFDKRSHFESLAAGACGNGLIAFKDNPKEYDAWNIDADFEKEFTELKMADSVTLTEKGPLRATIRVARTWQQSKFVQEISLYAGLDRVDVANDIDWHERHILLKAAFPLAASSPQATYEIAYGTIQRPTTRNNSWESAKFEVPAIRWADLGDGQHGVSLINEAKYGYDAKANVLRLSLLRSPTSPDPEADQGRQRFTYSLYPHAGDWKQALSMRRGYEFNYTLHAAQAQVHDGKLPAEHSYVSLDQPNVVLTAVKKAEDDNGLLFRFFEWAGKSGNVTVHVPEGGTSAVATNLMEKAEGSPLPWQDNQFTVPVHPFEIVTVRVDYPQK
ncbi:MAG: alpha-mannosidase [Acidobacteria bacterium]|nr:alpha-mannosidase [Acidobacteriota bacterium]